MKDCRKFASRDLVEGTNLLFPLLVCVEAVLLLLLQLRMSKYVAPFVLQQYV